MTWPGSPNAAQGGPSYPWGRSIALVCRAALLSGTSWHIGPHPNDRLDMGNVMGPLSGGVVDPQGRLWVDLACDLQQLQVTDTSTIGVGVVSRDEAATLSLTLYDPDRKYDPTNPQGPYWLNGHSRLTAGTYIEVTAEVLNSAGTGVVAYPLFKGLVDDWTSDVQPLPTARTTTVTASGSIKQLASRDYGQDDAPLYAGDTALQRVQHILTRFGWTGTVTQFGPTSTARMAATDFDGSCWQNLTDTADAEVGYLRVTPDGNVNLYTRNYLMALPLPAPALVIGCSSTVPGFDIATDLTVQSLEAQLRNAVYASRASQGSGDTPVVQVARSAASIGAHGNVEAVYRKDKLELVDDTNVAAWAQWVVGIYAYPEPTPRTVTLLPARVGEPDGHIWRPVLGMRILQDVLRVIWEPPGSGALDTQSWVMGVTHKITPSAWSVEFDLMAATRNAAKRWHIGPHANDKLNDGNVMGWAA